MPSEAEHRSLADLKRELKASAQRGYPLLLAGAGVFAALAIASRFLPDRTLHLAWVVGTGAIFPLGILLARALRVDLFASGNPLATVGGLVGGVQAAFIPVLVMVYENDPEWLPFTLGLLAGGHFLPYVWLYDSRGYLFLSVAMPVFSLIAGGLLIESAYLVVPIGIAAIFLASAAILVAENRRDAIPVADRRAPASGPQ